MIKFKLNKGHNIIFGEDTLFNHREAAERIEKYMYKNNLMIDLRKPPYNNMTKEKVKEINKHRERLVGKYLNIINPNYIVNMNWTNRGVLGIPKRYKDPNFIDITMKSINEWGIFVPIIVGALPEWHPYWSPPTKLFKYYDQRCTFIVEGRHRTYTAITTGLVSVKAFVLIPVKVEI